MGGYSDGSNTWPAVGGIDPVGKYYGERSQGNVAGVTCASDGEGRVVFEFDAAGFQDATLLASKTFSIPENYGLITAVYVEVDEAFDAGDVDLEIDGTDAGGTARSLATAGMFPYALTTTPTQLAAAEVLTVNVGATAVTGTAGYAKVIVEFTRV
jgi:hypothetical protein